MLLHNRMSTQENSSTFFVVVVVCWLFLCFSLFFAAAENKLLCVVINIGYVSAKEKHEKAEKVCVEEFSFFLRRHSVM